jgi:hypothetical protein
MVCRRHRHPSEGTAEERLAWPESRMMIAYAQLDVLHEAGQQESKDRTSDILCRVAGGR